MYMVKNKKTFYVFSQDRAACVSVLESMGFRVGQGLIERYMDTFSILYFFLWYHIKCSKL